MNKPSISVFTPTHNPKYLEELYTSLKEQTVSDWEWVIVPNNGAQVTSLQEDSRVVIKPYPENEPTTIGGLKAFACSHCSSDYLLEVDHDDLLTPTCMEDILSAFKEQSADFVYGNCAPVCVVEDKWVPDTYRTEIGWEYREADVIYNGSTIKVLETITPAPSPYTFSLIWFEPNHPRAWRKEFYWKIGGHSPLPVLDDQDLLCRTYINGKVHWVDKLLYIYRIHGDNSWLNEANVIQEKTWEIYHSYIFDMASRWADDNGLLKLDLCGGVDKQVGMISVDKKNGDVTTDLNNLWPFKDSSVGVLRASDALEHLTNPVHTMNEAYRVLTHGGLFFIEVPSTDGVGAFCDPTHVSFWNSRSFRYYTEAVMRKYLEPECNCRFQPIKIENIKKWDDIPYVRAHLLAVKDGPRFHGHLNI